MILIQIHKIYIFAHLNFFLSIHRFGQRTIQGILNDGWNALMRYYLNNFCDGTKQVHILSLFIPLSLQTSVNYSHAYLS